MDFKVLSTTTLLHQIDDTVAQELGVHPKMLLLIQV